MLGSGMLRRFTKRSHRRGCLFAMGALFGSLSWAQGERSEKFQRFESDILPLFQANCLVCHGANLRQNGLDLRTRDSVLRGGETGPAIVPGSAAESLLFEKVSSGVMPVGEKKLNALEIETIRGWIESAVPSGDSGAALVDRLVTESEVVALMWMHCTPCHGTRLQEAGLDLRRRVSMLQGGKSGPAVTPGDPDGSLIIRKIRAGVMPPPGRYREAGVKPVPEASLKKLAAWIAQGAPPEKTEPDVQQVAPDPLVSDKARQFWAFQPPRRVQPPTVQNSDRVRTPIDAFILRKLEEKGLSLSPEADRLTLMRRAYFDLTGLPPEPEEVERFLADADPKAYTKLIDDLLDSPRYGERWGRYWLDLAGYQEHSHAWRYRDYVIRSFDADKPYDRFLHKQIAGDELVDYENAPVVTDEMMDNLIATGFLRMAPDGTGNRETNSPPHRMQIVADEIEILSSAVLGLTVKCARCHSHKFDPIPQRDYYRLVAVFQGAYDIYDWIPPAFTDSPERKMLYFGTRVLPYVTPRTNPIKLAKERKRREAENGRLGQEIKALQAALAKKAEPLKKRVIEKRLAQLPKGLHDDLLEMLATPPEKRDELQKYLAEKFGKSLEIDPTGLSKDEELRKLDPEYKRASEETEQRIALLMARKHPEPEIRSLWDRGEPSPTYLLRRGDAMSPGRPVAPGVPAVLTDGKTPFVATPPWPGAKKTGRRLALARWLTQPRHPLTARVMVNRIWKYHFGKAIVSTLDDFGRMGARPTHPELLDWLATEFVRQGWSMKTMHRLMMTSSAYRQTSTVKPEHERTDRDNALLSRMPIRRMDAEALYDSLLLVAGRLDQTRFGPPDPVQVRKDGLVMPIEKKTGWRRSIYVKQKLGGSGVPTLLDNFDYPELNPNCIKRSEATVAPQALHLMNDSMIRELAASLAARVKREAGLEPRRQIDRVYLIALSRPPTEEERKISLDKLTQLTAAWSRNVASTAVPREQDAGMRALFTFCHTVLNTAAFIYVD